MLTRIAAAVEEQSATVRVISADVSTLNQIAEGNAASSEQVSANLSRLAGLAGQGKLQVQRFRT
ncbi:MAG: hypothetical protein HY900_12090 [Deltaproteobacteria bacterium]|nr:hypothetical protein [Deltaproteobacteria bacterium]